MLTNPIPFYMVDIDDPNEDPQNIFFAAAQRGSIDGMKWALSKDPSVLYMSDGFTGMSALHLAAAAKPNDGAAPGSAADAVRWLLERGIPWSAKDQDGCVAEGVAKGYNNEEARKVLRDWAVRFEYGLYYSPRGHPDHGKPFRITRMEGPKNNEEFCNSLVQYTRPRGAPDNEVALVSGSDGVGVMMEWERPIMRETARLLLDGMPQAGLRILNIGFGIGMIDNYFQEAQPFQHVIIEGHPTCLTWMKKNGWYDRPGVRILEGRWQDFFPAEGEKGNANQNEYASLKKLHRYLLSNGQTPLPLGPSDNSPSHSSSSPSENPSPNLSTTSPDDIGKFDIVYFDTFQEGYRGHFEFIKNVPSLLRGPGSKFSYFNGHGARSEVDYEVYMEVARLHHSDLGLNTEYFPTYVDLNTMWYKLAEADKKRNGDFYDDDFRSENEPPQHTVPICCLAPTVKRTDLSAAGFGWGNERFMVPRMGEGALKGGEGGRDEERKGH